MEINIAKSKETLKGDMEEGLVKKTGNGAYIPVLKKHLGKRVKIIIPKPCRYFWVFNETQLKKFEKECESKLEKFQGKLNAHRKEALTRVMENDFDERDISLLLSMFDEKRSEIVKLVASIYLKS